MVKRIFLFAAVILAACGGGARSAGGDNDPAIKAGTPRMLEERRPPSRNEGSALAISVASYNPAVLTENVCGEPGSAKRPDCEDPCGFDATLKRPCAYVVVYEDMAGDSLKYVIAWRQPVDGGGNADSTVYDLKATKPIQWWGGAAQAANTVRHLKRTNVADSLKLAKPAMGDSVLFNIINFKLCRGTQCSNPSAISWKYNRRPGAPAAATPSIRVDSF